MKSLQNKSPKPFLNWLIKLFVQAQSNDRSVPLNYYAVFKTVQANIPKDSIIVSEGANTMDIGRGLLLNNKPRHRLDAGTFGTMGVSEKKYEYIIKGCYLLNKE